MLAAQGRRSTVVRVTPQKRGLIPDPERARILAAMRALDDAEVELRAAVVSGLLAGGSVREMSMLTGMSTNTIQRWSREIVRP
ncbi:Uncharacterised protein [Rhodococcus gordoniae]|uniref:Uncharacterized protein n=1 Tax=Rhodococcus gordoniae TaxID=223392 RepID=A0A379M2U0_9NOCA|nr:Uncharacterised protein [Rhodococcus gordoniae]